LPYIAYTPHSRTTLFDLDETAVLLGVSRRTAWTYIATKKLPANRIAGRYLVSERTILAYFDGATINDTDNLGNDLPRPRHRAKLRKDAKPPQFARFAPVSLENVEEIDGYDESLQPPCYEAMNRIAAGKGADLPQD